MITPDQSAGARNMVLPRLPLLGAFVVERSGCLACLSTCFLGILWCWELFVFCPLSILPAAGIFPRAPDSRCNPGADRGGPEGLCRGSPREEWYRFWLAGLLCFVFPGYYWIHVRRSFDTRIIKVLDMLKTGVSLDRAFDFVPEVVSRDNRPGRHRRPVQRPAESGLETLARAALRPSWLELAPRLNVPAAAMAVLASNVTFMMIFIVPKFERSSPTSR